MAFKKYSLFQPTKYYEKANMVCLLILVNNGITKKKRE